MQIGFNAQLDQLLVVESGAQLKSPRAGNDRRWRELPELYGESTGDTSGSFGSVSLK